MQIGIANGFISKTVLAHRIALKYNISGTKNAHIGTFNVHPAYESDSAMEVNGDRWILSSKYNSSFYRICLLL